MAERKKPQDLRSFRWFGAEDLRSFGHRSRAYQMGYEQTEFAGKPVIAIINTWSDKPGKGIPSTVGPMGSGVICTRSISE
jgi:dihydroxyacid dehydratase/phosphogluconate dehydratase